MSKMFHCNRRVDTLKYFVRRMAEYPPSMQLKTLNLQRATARVSILNRPATSFREPWLHFQSRS